MLNKSYDILVIDDEKVIIDSIAKISGLENWTVDSAEDAAIAIQEKDLTKYRLLICDIMMPRMNGFQFLKELETKKINTPVIMVTGYTTVENAVKSLQQGAIDYIPKPFTVDELLCVIKRGLKQSDIMKDKYADSSYSSNPPSFVGCPTNYYRLGWLSWISIEKPGIVIIGLTNLFTKTIESIKNMELWNVDDRISQGNVCANIHTMDDLSYNLLAPISGKIIERNDKILVDGKLPEKDPYFNGWLYKILPSNLDNELKFLTPCSSDRI